MISKFKYKLVKNIEKIPLLQIYIYNFLTILKFLLPHEKDYHALKILFKKSEKRSFIDVGGNIGLSSLGWRSLGFNNKIYIFEPDKFLVNNYLIKIQKKESNFFIYPFGLSNKKIKKKFYRAYYKNKFFHFNNSFNKSYIKNKLKNNYPKHYKKFKILKDTLSLKKFDDLKFKSKICFIKIDVEGLDHLVIDGMKKTIKLNKPIILVEYNKENFYKIYKKLSYNYSCYSYLYEENKLKKFNILEIEKLMKGYYSLKKYNKNSINVFFIFKKYKKDKKKFLN